MDPHILIKDLLKNVIKNWTFEAASIAGKEFFLIFWGNKVYIYICLSAELTCMPMMA